MEAHWGHAGSAASASESPMYGWSCAKGSEVWSALFACFASFSARLRALAAALRLPPGLLLLDVLQLSYRSERERFTTSMQPAMAYEDKFVLV